MQVKARRDGFGRYGGAEGLRRGGGRMRLRGLSVATACGSLLVLVGLLLVKSPGTAQSAPGAALGPNDGTSLAVVPVAATRIRDQFIYTVPYLAGTVLTPVGSVSATS